jgi:hypothetical protein
VNIYRVEALSDVLARLPNGVIASQTWPDLATIEAEWCRCAWPELSATERRLLEDALDANDRLWDSELSVTELWKLYTAMAEAFDGTPHYDVFQAAVAELAAIVRTGLSSEEQHGRACGRTDDLRHYICRQLRGKLLASPPNAGTVVAPVRTGSLSLPSSEASRLAGK